MMEKALGLIAAISRSPRRGRLEDLRFHPPGSSRSKKKYSSMPGTRVESSLNVPQDPQFADVSSNHQEVPPNNTARSTQNSPMASPRQSLLPTSNNESPQSLQVPAYSALEEDSDHGSLHRFSQSRTLTPPGDSHVPLATSSGRVGNLLIGVHTSRTRRLMNNKLLVTSALSHQTWVSGEVLYFDLEIDNTSEKFIKRVEMQFVRTLSTRKNGRDALSSEMSVVECDRKVLATWCWRRGQGGWAGVSPQTQVTGIWNPIVPAGQATIRENGVEASYALLVILPTVFGRNSTSLIPLKIITPNSLGRLRLQQRLRHDDASQSSYLDTHSQPMNRVPSRRSSINTGARASLNGDDLQRSSSQFTRSQDIKPKATGSLFINSNPIPRASDELLHEILTKIQRTPKKKPLKSSKEAGSRRRGFRSRSRRHATQLETTNANSEKEVETASALLKPLSVIGAHSRRKSSDDAREAITEDSPSMHKLPTRASFDDRVLNRPKNPEHSDSTLTLTQSQSSNDNDRSEELSDASSRGADLGRFDTSSLSKSTISIDTVDLARFIKQRQNFHGSGRVSSNPFFKGSAGKERLRSARYAGLRSLAGQEDNQQISRDLPVYNSPTHNQDDTSEGSLVLSENPCLQGTSATTNTATDFRPISTRRSGQKNRILPGPRDDALTSWKYMGAKALF